MDPDMHMILPKGIVINTNNIYREVAGFSTIPTSKVWEYWHVYTTTHKRLKDPTACRLENFWWHVWGSDRKHLKGQTLAKIYEHISTGPTFVPLRGPPNRWESPDMPPFAKQLFEEIQTESTPLPTPPAKPRQLSKTGGSGLRVLSSSASKPPPAHPILKKNRGSSSSGPKPTARFVSPVPSDNEVDIPSSGSTAATVTEAPVYVSSSPKKKPTPPPKKFVVTTAAKKRRPSLPRRQSSDHGPRESAPQGAIRQVAPRPVTPIVEDHSEHTAHQSEGEISPTSQPPPQLSEKARGKQPAIPRRPVPLSNGQLRHNTYAAPQPEPFWSNESAPFKLPQTHSLVDLNGHVRRRDSATSRSPLTVGSLQSNSSIDLSRMARSQSYNMLDVQNDPNRRVPATGLLSTATAETSKVDATGTILDQSGQSAVPEPKMSEKRPPSHHSIPIERKRSILDATFTPTPPSTAASVPLGRTKSQLTLLLEREKARARGELLPNI
ncbi:hypothetical protein BGZ63DRAFT_421544 [Mariannaea sp. PMI_226]|nr:hypothetical protein BGZ63DRAFT_421544 [Mariannaea sp. PMI_226]